MDRIRRIFIVVAVVLAVVMWGCSSEKGAGEEGHGEHSHGAGEHGGEGRGEHDRDSGGDEEGEESGTEYGLEDTYDNVRNGARLILAYDKVSNSFNGTVENVTEKTLERVRVEVHLSNAKELGPTTPTDLGPGAKMEVTLKATSTGFEGWSAHPEVGNEEHSHGEGEHSHEGEGEHGGREGRGEHE